MGLRPLLVCSALLVSAQLASAQAKVAVINLQRAVFESAEIKKADAQMQATFKPRQDKIDALTKISRVYRNSCSPPTESFLRPPKPICRPRVSASNAICSA